MKKNDIQILLDKLYEYISFQEGEEPNFFRINELFVDGAKVIEYKDKDFINYNEKNINLHILEMNEVFSKYPLIKSKGFREKEIENDIIINGPVAFVKSRYLKKYFNGKDNIESTGINCMQIAKLNNTLKIISISWYEN
ncbi:hypothetical protein JXR93_07855 [bacterium]|nr:hypothetical protein [bacterium]